MACNQPTQASRAEINQHGNTVLQVNFRRMMPPAYAIIGQENALLF
jgi:hypothetical protein